MASLAQINVKFTADLRGFSTEMQKALRIVGKVGEDMQRVGKSLSTYVTAPLLLAGGAAVKFASDYNESLNKVNVAFGDASGGVEQFAKKSLESFGIAEGSALDMAALFGDMATSMNIPVEKAAAMSQSLVGLAGDLASFKNIGIEQATTALNGVFTGETESLKRLGVVMTEANLQTFALSKGIQTQVQDMSQAEKVTLRYAFVMDQTKNAQGDFARTGGGAANQMRIFQESLKQVAAQLGQVILPFFTKVISTVNSAVKSFSGLSGETKTTVVAFAAVAAAIGPVLAGMGSMLTMIPNTIDKFNALKDNLKALQAVLLANPFTAVAVALGAIAAIALVSMSRFTSLTDATAEFDKITEKAAGSVAKESAELNKNLSIAKNKALSDKERKTAIENINALSPEYLGNITLENLYTTQTTAAIGKYTAALLQKAKVQASNEKLVEVEKKLLDLMLGQTDAVKPSVWQNLFNIMKTGGNAMLFTSESAKTLGQNFGKETVELMKLRDMLVSFVSANGGVVKSNEAVGISLENLAGKTGFKAGTIAFYEDQIDKLKKLQEEIPTTNEAWKTYESQITAIQAKIDGLTKTGIKLPKPELPEGELIIPTFSLGDLKSQLAELEKLQENATNSTEFEDYAKRIENVKIKIGAIETEEFTTSIDDFKTQMVDIGTVLEEQFAAFQENAVSSFASLLGGVASGAVGLQGLFAGLLGVVADFMVSLGKSLIQVGIASKAFKSAFTNPYVAIAAGAALIVFGAAFKNLMQRGPGGGSTPFANGGLVYGPVNALIGEYSSARVDPEVIAPLSKLRGMLGDAGSAVEVSLNGSFDIDGQKLKLLLDRVETRNNRTR